MKIIDYIGNTPIVKLNFNSTDLADIYVKIEHFNAGGSVKARIAKKMVEEAENNKQLMEGMTIIEPTGGNTGIGLAMVSLIKGYKFKAVVPDNFSIERINLLKIYNAEVILSDSKLGNDSHIQLANKLLKEDSKLVCLNQFNNQACITAHYEGTANEIIKYIIPDAFVVCVGSSGTFTGVSLRLREKNKNIKCYVAQPRGCDILKGTAVPHMVQGVSLGIKPPLLDYSLIDGILDIDYDDIMAVLKLLVKTQGLYLGISAGANIVAAYKIAKTIGKDKIVCTVAPDGGQYYKNEIYMEGENNGKN
jgi:cysteine synthase A